MQAASSNTAASFSAARCRLMPQASAALMETFTAPQGIALSPLPASRAFFSPSALLGYARALALKSPRAPPAVSLSFA